jgi:membrane dipeptidase
MKNRRRGLAGLATKANKHRARENEKRSASTGQLLAAKLHKESIVIDGHVHVISRVFHEGIDPWKAQTTGLIDFARAQQGGVKVIIHALYLEDPYNRYNYTIKHACRLLEIFHQVMDANSDKMELALNSADVRRIVAKGKMAHILGFEGGFDMDGDLQVLRFFHRVGVRMLQFVHHRTTSSFADSYGDEVQKWNGINDRGRELVSEMNRLGILIDISHATIPTQEQIIKTSQAPVVASHVGAKRFSNHPQNLSDELIEAVAKKGGLIGVHGHGSFLCQKYWDWRRLEHETVSWRTEAMQMKREPIDSAEYIDKLDNLLHKEWSEGPTTFYGTPWKKTYPARAPIPTMDDYVATVDYLINLVGDDHVAIGLDLMFGTYWLKDFDATGYPRITEALVAKGYSAKTIKKILGENWLRVLDASKA